MIFQTGNTPLVFFMPECPEKSEIFKLIRENGGLCSSEHTSQSIYILPYEKTFIIKESFPHPVYSYNFILHSVSLQEAQNLSEYQLNPTAKSVPKNTSKIIYSAKEDNLMKEFVKNIPGNPINLSYWTAFKSATGTTRSVDSLRGHWKIICQDPENQKKLKKAVPKYKQILINRLQKIDEEDLDCSENQSEKIQIDPSCFDADKYFEDLLDVCYHKSKRKIDPAELVRALLKCEGNVQRTIEEVTKTSN